MIQRIQSIYLLLALVLILLLLFFPIFSIQFQTESAEVFHTSYFNSEGLMDEDGTVRGAIPMYSIYISLSLFSGLCILMYKKRPRQLLLTRLNFMLHIILVVGIYLFYFFGESFITKGVEMLDDQTVSIALFLDTGFFLLIPSVAFLWLAIRGIKRDEMLVNSLDRLR